jgi:hypothetical protein
MSILTKHSIFDEIVFFKNHNIFTNKLSIFKLSPITAEVFRQTDVVGNSPFFGKENNYSGLTFGKRRKGKKDN